MTDTVHPAITDPHVRAHLARLAAVSGSIPSTATDAAGDDAARIVELRRNPSWTRLPDDDAVESLDARVDDALALRFYRPRAGFRGTLVFAHGGGWVAGNLNNNDALCRALAVATGTQVLSADYRLAPEHPFPAGVDDLGRTLRFAADGAGGLVPDTAALGVAGHSAGGNLAAALALRSRAGRAPAIRCQVLLCPVLDAPDPGRPSYRAHTANLPLTARGMQWYWNLYLGGRHEPVAAEAAPLRAEDLSGSAPAAIVAAAVDPLSDEAEEYAGRLTAVGTPVRFVRCAGVPHLFLTFPAMSARDAALAEIAPFVRAAFA